MLRDMFQFKLVAFFIIEFQCQRYVSESSKPVLPNDIKLCNVNNSHKNFYLQQVLNYKHISPILYQLASLKKDF